MTKSIHRQKSKPFFITLIFLLLAFSKSFAQYCTIPFQGSCMDNLTGVSILGTTLNNVNNGCGTNGVSTFPASGNTTATLLQGETYTIKITSIDCEFLSIWIDYNHNFIYDSIEWVKPDSVSRVYYTNVQVAFVYAAYITVPLNAAIGQTGMRIRSRAPNMNSATDACTQMGTGETENYTITIAAATVCQSPPNAGSTLSSIPIVCSGELDTLSLSGNSTGSTQSYQWQSSPDSLVWGDISGATKSYLIHHPTAAAYYRCRVTCSSMDAYSIPVKVPLTLARLCYCRSTSYDIPKANIGWFQLGSLISGVDSTDENNPTAIDLYTYYSNLVPTVFNRGANYIIKTIMTSISNPVGGNHTLDAYIDYDQNGIYSASEIIFNATLSRNTGAGQNKANGIVTIPSNALTGITGLRVVLYKAPPIIGPCGKYLVGETEDYLLNIDFPQTDKLSTIQNPSLFVYPNPTSNQLTVSFDNIVRGNGSIKLVNSVGQIVYDEKLPQIEGSFLKTLDVSQFAKGIYSLQLLTSGGTANKKVILK